MERLSLVEALAAVPDPRRRKGVRRPWTALLSLAVAAVLAGMKSPEAIARFGRDHGPALAHALCFRRGQTPAKGTLSKRFRRMDLDAFEAALGRRLLARRDDGGQALAVDGMAPRGAADGQAPGVHLLTAFVPAAAAVPRQRRVEGKTNEHQAALRLLGVPPLEGRVVTGGALFTHRDAAAAIRKGGGDCMPFVKDNQPELKARFQAAFHDDAGLSPLPA
jgi:hypothetical protein